MNKYNEYAKQIWEDDDLPEPSYKEDQAYMSQMAKEKAELDKILDRTTYHSGPLMWRNGTEQYGNTHLTIYPLRLPDGEMIYSFDADGEPSTSFYRDRIIPWYMKRIAKKLSLLPGTSHIYIISDEVTWQHKRLPTEPEAIEAVKEIVIHILEAALIVEAAKAHIGVM